MGILMGLVLLIGLRDIGIGIEGLVCMDRYMVYGVHGTLWLLIGACIWENEQENVKNGMQIIDYEENVDSVNGNPKPKEQ